MTEKKQGITVFREPSYGGRGQRRFEDTFPSRYGELSSSPIRTETRYSLPKVMLSHNELRWYSGICRPLEACFF